MAQTNTPSSTASYLREYFLTKTGNNTVDGHILPKTDDTYDIGSATLPFRTIYATSLVGVGGSTDELVAVQSGDTPGYLDSVLLAGTGLGKVASAGVLTLSLSNTPLWADGSNALTGNLTVNSGITVDGVDISVFKTAYDAHAANINAHHDKQHSIIDAAHHSVTGSQYNVVGLSGTNTLGILSTTNDGSSSFNTILRSSGAGNLKLASLTSPILDSTGHITMSPTSNIVFSPTGSVVLTTDKLFVLGSGTFTSGFAGAGGRIDYNVSRTGKSTIEVDDMYIRGRLNVYELVIQQIRATNGNVFVTDSAKIYSVTGTGPYTLTVDGDTNDYQPFAVNDVIRAQRVNLGSGIQVWQSDLTVTAINVGGDVKKFTATLSGGSDVPAKGMEYVRLGNTTDTSRQGAVYLTSSDSNAPFIDIIDGVTSHAGFNSYGNVKVRLGKLSGISDPDFTMSGYGLYSENAYLKGEISAASDAVRIDSNGIRVKANLSTTSNIGAYKFINATNAIIGGIYGVEIPTNPVNLISVNAQVASYGSVASLYAHSDTGTNQEARAILGVVGDGSSPASKSTAITVYSPGGASGDARIEIGDSGGTTNYVTSFIEWRASKVIKPTTDLGTDLGTALKRWGTLYVDQIIATTIGGTTLTGAEWEYAGDMVIDANSASTTTISLVNQGAGRADVVIDRNLTVGGDIIVTGNVDGVDVAALSTSFSSHTSNVDAHHNRDHELASSAGLGATHTVSGLTAGHVLRASGSTTALFAQLAHSDLSGLTSGDPHTQYVRKTSATTITAVHTFNPSTATPWIILGANATGQLITGLNADLLDGYDSAIFPRKAENATIAGTWTFGALVTFSSGVKLKFADVVEDKIILYSNTYGIGIETNTTTLWSPTTFNFRAGATSSSTGTIVGALTASLFSLPGVVQASSNVDSIHVLGKGKLGGLTGVSTDFAISHYDFATSGGYLVKMTSSGDSMLNAGSSRNVQIRINNSQKIKVDTTDTTISTNVGIGMTPTVALDVTGNFVLTGTATASSDSDSTHIFGRAKIHSATTDNAMFSHFDHATSTNYGFRQSSAGQTVVNTATGQIGYLRNNNSDIASWTSAGLILATSKSIVSATFNSTSPIAGFSLSEISGNKYGLTIGSIAADELNVKTFVAQETRVDRGDEWWGKGFGIIETAFTTPAATGGDGVEVWFLSSPSVAGALFTNADWIRIRTLDFTTGIVINDIWGQVYTAASGAVNGYLLQTTPSDAINRQRWRFVLRSGTLNLGVTSGVTATNFGASGQAMINLSTVDTAGAPYIKMGRWSGANPYTPANHVAEVIIGKLGSVSGPTGTVGLYSAYNSTSVEISDAGALFKSVPIQSFNGANQTFNLSSTGTDTWIGVSAGDKRLTWNGTTLAVTGTVTATAGAIGGWTLTTTGLTSTGIALRPHGWTGGGLAAVVVGSGSSTSGIDAAATDPDIAFWAGGAYASKSSAAFRVTLGGQLTATSATITGAITATSGAIGGWTVGASTIASTGITLTHSGTADTANIFVGSGANGGGISASDGTTSDIVIWAGQTFASRSSAPFKVTANGALTATSATITGAITASSGSITGFLTIGTSGGIYQGTGTSGSPTTGLKIWNDSGVGRIAGYNAGTVQWYANTDGKLYAGAGNVYLDSSGITLASSATGATYLRALGASGDGTRYMTESTLVGDGTTNHEIITRPTNASFDQIASSKLSVSNTTWTGTYSIGVYRDIYDHFGFVNDKMLVGVSTNPSSNISSLVAQYGTTVSSISLANTTSGNAAHIGFNANMASVAGSYTASGAWKFLGSQYTGNVTRPGLISWDGNSGSFTLRMGEAGLANGANITTWTSLLQVNSSGNLTITGNLELAGFSAAWTGVSFGTGWGNYGGAFANVKYCKIGDMVYLTGLATRTSGTGLTIGTLPSGYRPTNQVMFSSIYTGNLSARIDIDSAGVITWIGGTTTVGHWVTLSGISFRTNE